MQGLIDELKKLTETGAKISELEDNIGLPKNSLSSRLTGKVSFPESWIPKVQKYLNTMNAPIASPEPPKMVVKSNGSLSLKPSDEAQKRAKDAIDKINKDFGAGSVMRLGDEPMANVEVISTGSVGLNSALGVQGLPKGRITEIYGPESSGKTTIALHAIAEAQKRGGLCAFIDVEHAFDQTYAQAIGVNTNELRLSQPDYGEQALEEADRLIGTGAFSIVVIDSVAALVPKSELEGEMGDSKMGAQARLMSQACRKLAGVISKSNTICIFINQLRSTIGNMYVFEVTSGGNALKFYASIRLDVRRAAQLKDGDEIYGNRVRVKVVKNKVAPPFKTTEFDILFGEGIDHAGEIIDAAAERNIIVKSGSWFSYADSKLGQGRETVRQLLKDNDQLFKEIETKVLQP